MLTNDDNIIHLKEDILNNSLEVELIRITLSNNAEEIHGKGILCQDNTGRLIIKFFSDTNIDNFERLRLIVDDNNSGNSEGYIMTQSDYWSISGLDSNQIEYKCDRLYSHHPKDNYSVFYLCDKLFSNRSFTSTRILCIGKYEIPRSDYYHTLTKGTDFYFTENYSFFEVELTTDIKLRVIEYSSYVDIIVNHSTEIDINIIWNIIQALNFVFGIDLNVSFISISDKGHWLYPYPKKGQDKSIFSAPLSIGRSYSNDFFSNHKLLIKKYFKFICQDTEQQLPIIQKRIWSAGQSYPYILAVVLSTQVESICKLYYSSFYKFDKSQYDLYNKVIAIIQDSKKLTPKEVEGVCDTLKNRLPKENPSRQNLNPKQILNSLHQNNTISEKKFISVWNSLRSFTAHGDKLESNAKDNDKMVRGIYICTNLYYELVFRLIGYVGIYSYKKYDNNKLRFYFPYKLSDLAISDNENIEYNGRVMTVIDAIENVITENGENINFQDWINGIINTHIDYTPLSHIRYKEGNFDILSEKVNLITPIQNHQ